MKKFEWVQGKFGMMWLWSDCLFFLSCRTFRAYLLAMAVLIPVIFRQFIVTVLVLSSRRVLQRVKYHMPCDSGIIIALSFYD